MLKLFNITLSIAETLRKIDDRVKSLVKLKFQTILYEVQYGSLQGGSYGGMGYTPTSPPNAAM
jgi:hypothetical protein